MDKNKIGNFIAIKRKELGLNQKELAEKLSVTDKAVSKWETGRGVPEVSLLIPLANLLNVSVTELLNGEEIAKEDMSSATDNLIIKSLKYTPSRLSYISLCVISIFNFIYDNYITIARTHLGQVMGETFLGKTYDFIVGLEVYALVICICLPCIISIIISIVVFVSYRKVLTKKTGYLAMFGFLPYLLFTVLCFVGGGMETIVVGIIKVIYSIIMIICMVKDIKRLSA